MKENVLYAPITSSFNTDGWIAVKIVDGSMGLKPFDIFGVSPTGRAMCCEVKVHDVKKVKDFPENLFAKHQIAYMQAYAKRGAYSIAAVYNPQSKLLYLYKPNTSGNFVVFGLTEYKKERFDNIGDFVTRTYDQI